MYEVLEPLHAMMEKGPQTLKETSFNQTYGRDLVEALECCNRYLVSENIRDLNKAWDLYYQVFRRISRQLPQLTTLELQYVSPKLQQSRNMELAVPGSYIPGQPVVKIAYIQSSLQVITSKQRPRKLCIKGSDGNDYMFLLKGHEDLRQDERVMQLFGLVNTLLLNDPDTFRRNLTIQRYAVIPLSTNSGLIGWVPHCDTLHTLIRDYRDKKKILLNIEHRIMLRMSPDYDHLLIWQKVEVFEHALANTQGDDLARLLWLKSPSSEVWFDRRTNYTRSLAVMSMVGYILGLGDRHPSNLMLDRLSGKILHIDFGDCFEVAMTREKFPEKIPFRLTRMLTNAMEVTGIEGTYRSTCVSVMTVLRNNKDSLMAVLEAFVYDPLLNWRLMETGVGSRKTAAIIAGPTVIENPISVTFAVTTASDETSLATSFATSLSKNAAPINITLGDDPNESEPTEALNKKALAIITRVREKLTGRDFIHEPELDVHKQVHLLILQATANENLCQCYIGWCPFW
ncbi:Phosphatidylinositol 3-/4-kinase, catalytic domain,FATC domain,Protein kinase-like [Cinara cedri]|uniref:non-specific serine/threonine protein kinase n=1 Tax=Cinara cedri TaxID=506608 RepID=A0A5E4M9Z3_9HEMI|nr:Phosphatidylinositol 3-/4-kinase, catalytic domain,FATC domain,Protein kinase-like [Cinara cedri]